MWSVSPCTQLNYRVISNQKIKPTSEGDKSNVAYHSETAINSIINSKLSGFKISIINFNYSVNLLFSLGSARQLC